MTFVLPTPRDVIAKTDKLRKWIEDIFSDLNAGYLNKSGSETVIGTANASLDVLVTDIDSSGGAATVTCPNGEYEGQRKVFTMSDATASSTVSCTSHLTSDPEVFTFAQTTDVLILEWISALAKWRTVFNNGAAT